MTTEQLIAQIVAGPVRLLFDANVLFKTEVVLNTCQEVARIEDVYRSELRAPVRDGKRIELLIPAQVYAERLFDLKQNYKHNYDVRKAEAAVLRMGMSILSFADNHARELAVMLGERFGTVETWRAAKRQRCMACIGLPAAHHALAVGKGRRCGATIDWLIAAHARAEGCILVTDDKGDEFKRFEPRVKLDTLCGAIEQILAEPGLLLPATDDTGAHSPLAVRDNDDGNA